MKHTFPFSPTNDTWRIVDSADSAYWSGLDVQVYIEDIILDQCLQFNYQVAEKVTPYYGYASFVPDRIHHGSRLITGEFTQNVRNMEYTQTLFTTLRNRVGGETLALAASEPEQFNSSVPAADVSDMSPASIKAFVERRKRSTRYIGDIPKSNFVQVSSGRSLFEVHRSGVVLTVVIGGQLDQEKILKYDKGYVERVKAPEHPQRSQFVGTGIRFIGTSMIGVTSTMADDGRAFVETFQFMARDYRYLTPSEVQLVTATPTTIEEEAAIGGVPTSYKW